MNHVIILLTVFRNDQVNWKVQTEAVVFTSVLNMQIKIVFLLVE